MFQNQNQAVCYHLNADSSPWLSSQTSAGGGGGVFCEMMTDGGGLSDRVAAAAAAAVSVARDSESPSVLVSLVWFSSSSPW